MPHSYVSNLMHCIFSTKGRRKQIGPDLQSRLWPFIGGIARKNNMHAVIVGGMSDHVHVLLAVPATIAVAKAIQLIKGGSSKWIHDTFPESRSFEWQEGYGAFSITLSHREATINYIQHQEEHHRRRSFEQESLAILKKHGIEYDARYVFG